MEDVINYGHLLFTIITDIVADLHHRYSSFFFTENFLNLIEHWLCLCVRVAINFMFFSCFCSFEYHAAADLVKEVQFDEVEGP